MIEMLVVIGIVVALGALLFPMLSRALKSGDRAKAAADLATISVALDQYKGDFGNYPRVEVRDSGAAVLGKALLGPYGDGAMPPFPPGSNDPNDPPTYAGATIYNFGDAVQSSGATYVYINRTPASGQAVGNTTYWIPFGARDGADGDGFRTRANSKVWGPYIQTGRMKARGVALLDGNSSPILYFSANPGKPAITANNGFVSAGLQSSLYNAHNNIGIFKSITGDTDATAFRIIASMLGDYNPLNPSSSTSCDGKIDLAENEVAASEQPYLLWSAGPDGIFGPVHNSANPTGFPTRDDIAKCDDVTNFK